MLTLPVVSASTIRTERGEAELQQNNPVPTSSSPQNPDSPAQPSETSRGPPPTGPCVDPDNAVIATRLASTGVHPRRLRGARPPTSPNARPARLLLFQTLYGPVFWPRSPVDASGDGSSIDSPSPTYGQDGLIFRLITTGSDNRIAGAITTINRRPSPTDPDMGSTQSAGELIVATVTLGSRPPPPIRRSPERL